MFIEKVEKETLLKPLQIVTGIVERKQTLPILSNVLIENQGSSMTFTATDLEIQISTSIDIERPSTNQESITLGGKKLQEVLRVLPEKASLSVEVKESKAQIKANKSKFSLQTLPAQDFPKLGLQLENAKEISLSQKSLKYLLQSVQYAMAQQDVRYYLNGLLLVIEGGLLKAIATDGHRLAYNAIELGTAQQEKTEIILPRKAVMELSRLLSDNEDDKVLLEVSAQQAKASFSGITLVSKLIDGKFPDYERVIPKYDQHMMLDRLTILQALQRVAILSNEKFRGVRFILTEKNLKIVSSNSEQEEAQEELETDFHGNGIDIGFNINYLLEGLNNVSGSTVSYAFGDANSSILMKTPDTPHYSYVVMPMRI
jgi:DNA polymerase-3 subunit beta